MKISALDLAAVSGLAFGELPKPAFTFLDMTKLRWRGERGAALMRFLIKHFDEYRPELVVIEQPMDAHVEAKMGATLDVSIALKGYVMIAETVAHSRRILTELVRVQDARKHFVGQRTFAGSKDGKRAVYARCRQLGWEPPNLDCSDAAALWDFAHAVRSAGFSRIAAARPIMPALLPGPAKKRRKTRAPAATLL